MALKTLYYNGKPLTLSGKTLKVDVSAADSIQHADIPDYVKAEALAVAEKVKAVRTSDSIVFIAASDAHQQDSSTDIVAGNLNAAQAMKALAYILPGIDFCCYLGDYTWGASTTTIAETKQHIAEINADIDEAFQGYRSFGRWAITTRERMPSRRTGRRYRIRSFSSLSGNIAREPLMARLSQDTATETSRAKSCA